MGRRATATSCASAVLVLVVLAGALLALAHFREQRVREADRALRDALTTFEAPLSAEIPAGAQSVRAAQVFASAEEKYKKAAAAFDGVERRYGSQAAGQRATYFAALSRLELGQYAEAEKGAQGDPGARRRARAGPRAAGARRRLPPQRPDGQGGRSVPLVRLQPARPACRATTRS